MRTYVLQTDEGQITETHSISAGLDYPGVGPEHAWLKASGRAEYLVATDEDALRGFRLITQSEGIIPGLYLKDWFHTFTHHLTISLGIGACNLGGHRACQDHAQG